MPNKDQYLNRKRTAVALSYTKEDVAPKVIAKGQGHIADKIVEKAKEENIPIKEDEQVASSLSKLNLGDCIPPELYEVIAEILVYVDDMDRIKSKIF